MQIIDILNRSKNLMIKWSGHIEMESLPAKLQRNTNISSNSLKITQKYQSIEVVQLKETSG